VAYICIKKVGNKKYYYLRKSIKKQGKTISKDICYLGKNLSKINLNELEKKFPDEIKNSKINLKKFLESNYYFEKSKKNSIKENKFFNKTQIAEINSVLNHFKKLKSKKKKQKLEEFKISFITENASAEYYERRPLKKEEVKKLIEKELYPKNKLLSKIHEVINTHKILKFLEKEKPKINIKFIEKIHNMLMEYSGIKGYRNHSIKIKGNAFKPTSEKNIKSELKKLLSWYHKNKTKIHPLALAILFHHKFEKIHPFFRGNGETGRIIMNFMLSSFNYPPIIIPFKKREEYFKTMNKAYKCLEKDLLNTDMKYYKPLIDFMHKQFAKTYWDNFIS